MSPITRDPSTRTDETEAPGGTAAAARADDGRSTRWEDHREARRAELVRVARRVVHHEGPDVSMDDIAAAAGTSKSIVYRYFTDKDGLQLAVAAAVVGDIRDALDEAATGASTPRDALRGMVDTYLSMIESSPHVYAFVTRGGSVGHFLDSVTELVAVPFVRALGVAGEGDGTPDDGTPAGPDADWARLWAAGAVGFVRGAGERWLAARDQPDADREDVATRVAAWLWAGPVGVLSRERTARPVAGEATDATEAIGATDAVRPPG
ncbi:TetR/AcrR family transcriptional regulator [Cellulomonas hominis]|uniref:TetR/AcrR family transcriptional regulator n=1 Tax=Cellulomonas hominis TaxID=156981 RepID=UPI001B96EA00|nr:TetR/AcrR family transcriptional regulator [Cellulomonas hominis]VTR77707.1 putative HTH-type transcriptional regulator [Cellulomonas hominis]